MQETFSGGDACRQMTTGAHRHGPRGGIFLRTFLGFLALTLVTVLLFTFFLTATLQAERQAAYEDEVRAQAREVAGYVSHLNQLQFVFESSTMRYVLLSKMQTIHDHYNADVWIVSYDDGRLIYQFLDSGGNIVDPRYISSEAVLAQIASVYQGNEIRVQGGAYGTGLLVRETGLVSAYTYRDPDCRRSRGAIGRTAAYLEAAAASGEAQDVNVSGRLRRPNRQRAG